MEELLCGGTGDFLGHSTGRLLVLAIGEIPKVNY